MLQLQASEMVDGNGRLIRYICRLFRKLNSSAHITHMVGILGDSFSHTWPHTFYENMQNVVSAPNLCGSMMFDAVAHFNVEQTFT